jgi:hypothetical protein
MMTQRIRSGKVTMKEIRRERMKKLLKLNV